MPQNSLKTQIIALCVALVVVSSGSILSSSWWFSSHHNAAYVKETIDNAQNVFQQYLRAQEGLLVTATTVLTNDFGFKQAVASRDAATIESVLDNHGDRINADLMLLLDTRGELIRTSASKQTQPSDTINNQSLQGILESPGKANFVVIANTLYQIFILPVRAPRTIAYSVVGFKIDDKVAQELKRLTGLEVSFVSIDQNLYASTLSLPADIPLQQVVEAHSFHWFWRDRPDYSNRVVLLTTKNDSQTSSPQNQVAVISKDLRPSYLDFEQRIQTMLWIAAFIILVAILASIWLGNRLTTPLEKLVAIAKRFSRGDYKGDLSTLSPSVEMTILFNTFREMGHEVEAREQQVLFQAQHDLLTGLYNRNTLLSLVEKQLEQQSPFMLMAFNVRQFKSINDNLGSAIGDSYLKAIAQRLTIKAAEGHDSYRMNHARFGDDQFLSLIPLTTTTAAESVALQLIDALNVPFDVNGLKLNHPICAGYCLYPEHANTAKSLVRRTGIALEKSRKAGVKLLPYHTGDDESHLERLALIEELKTAMSKNDGQLFMFYQPKLHLAMGKVNKVEALIRWRKPNGSMISPELFIALAEQAGLIVELTHWVINEVLHDLQRWQADNIFTEASINISAQDISHPDFTEFLVARASHYKIKPSYITLELTERDLMENEQAASDILHNLRALGYTISVDDYGVGQSSLSKLKKLPIHEIKIDKSFILKLASSETDQIIVRSTVNLSHNLGFSVVAEGVEDEESLQLLTQMGCDLIQGYHLSRPMAANDFPLWLKNYESNAH
ncbi:bifunctional diguanylate cyclase/phosphodiesterase [Teredinibacter waterburyi]|jgi:diguanylate cyclase (GGDEF) domain|uniref:bifunctional diguanylate cyclase/phosphodiesterase n=1 Tax=Teredinibacter waterburyi TaxID=1500538 RepID=UPI00165F8573|nr:EAL domain-containing protein [Teredinibacter waterburyi]